MMIAVAILILLLVLGGVMGGLVYWKFKKTDPNNYDTTLRNDIETAQEFLPFEDIRDSVINLGNHNYRAIIECNSINYHLKTEREKEIIELSYQRFLNSLTHAITIFIQTRTIDNTKILLNLKNEIEETVKEFPYLINYGQQFLNDMDNLNVELGTNQQKKKYIIVPYNDSANLTNSSDDEKYEDSLKELSTRCQILIEALSGMGIKGNLLNTQQVVELLCSTYYKDNYAQSEQIINGEYLALHVDGTNKLANVTPDGRLDWILYEAQLRLQGELTEDNNVPNDIKQNAIEAINEINKIREAVAGYYKTKDNNEFLEI